MRILFICTGNSFRSPTAEALAREFRPDLEVESAGIHAIGYISEPALNFLKDHGAIRFVKPEPDQISQRAIDEADRIVCMMPEHREYIQDHYHVDDSKVEVWNIKDGIRPEVDPDESLHKILKGVQNM